MAAGTSWNVIIGSIASSIAILIQLDAQYAVLLTEGRPMQVKFEVAANSTLTLTDRVGAERLSDKIVQCIKQ